jgi:hypothetical protein
MRFFLLAFLFSLPLLASAQELAFVGTWEGGDTAAESIYGVMALSESNISWGDSFQDLTCHAGYTLIHGKIGDKLDDQLGHGFLSSAGSSFKTYLLKLKNETCTSVSYLRLTVEDGSPNTLALVEYNEQGTPLGWMHFFRVQQARNLTTYSSERAAHR